MSGRRRHPVRSSLPAAACRAAAVAVLCATAPPAGAQYLNQLPEPVQGMEIEDARGRSVPLDLPVTRSTGAAGRLGDQFDGERPVVLVMMYTSCPVVCPTIMQQTMDTLNEIDFALGRDYRAVFVSFDQRDTPDVLATEREVALLRYRRTRTREMQEGLVFLGTQPAEARALGEALGFPFRYLPESGEFAHGTGIYLLTPDGRVSRFLGGLDFPAQTVRMGLLEAGDGKIGNVFDRVTLWCYHFDPKEGSYSLQAFRVMQIGGGLTAVLLGSLVTVLVIGERRRRRRRRQGDEHSTDQVMTHTHLAMAGGGAGGRSS